MSLSDLSNLNLMDTIVSMQKARAALVDNNAAYFQAEQVLKSVNLVIGHRVVDEDGHSKD